MRYRAAVLALLCLLACAAVVALLPPEVRALTGEVAGRPVRFARGFWDAVTKPLPAR